MLVMICVVSVVVIYPRLKSMISLGITGLPPEIKTIVFEESKFAEPITVELEGGSGVVNDNLRNFLIKMGYAVSWTSDKWPFIEELYYTEAIEPHILSGSPGSYFTLLLARRKLKRIGFTNQYEEWDAKFYAVNFTYTLEEVLPGLPDIRKEFEGKAILWWDPSEGAWTLYTMKLEDRRYLEYFPKR
jgi:hypothetical protein